MKKLLAMLVLCSMIFALTACSKPEEPTTAAPTTAAPTEATTAAKPQLPPGFVPPAPVEINKDTDRVLILTDLNDMSIKAIRGGVFEQFTHNWSTDSAALRITGNNVFADSECTERMQFTGESMHFGDKYAQIMIVPKDITEIYVEPIKAENASNGEMVTIDLLDDSTWDDYAFEVVDVVEEKADKHIVKVTLGESKEENKDRESPMLYVNGTKYEHVDFYNSEKHENCEEWVYEIPEPAEDHNSFEIQMKIYEVEILGGGDAVKITIE